MVNCLLCGQSFSRITRTHLKKHNLTTIEYKGLFPEAELFDLDLRQKYGKFFRNDNPMKLEINRKNMSEVHRGKQVSEETREKIRRKRKGKTMGPMSQITKEKISKANKDAFAKNKLEGKNRPKYVMSEEARQRMSNRMLGNTLGSLGNHNKGQSLNLSKEQRDNRSKKRVEYLKNNKSRQFSGTKPELKFIDFLVEHNIEFSHQYPIHTSNRSWLFDFYLPELNLLVEIDGEYFHSKKQSITRDLIKEKVSKNNQFRFVRISTNDLNFNIIHCTNEEINAHNKSIMMNRINKLNE